MDAKLIMEYYGVACAILLPLCLILVLIMARKGGPIDKLNKWIDRIFVKKEETVQEKAPAEKEENQESEWEMNSKTLTCLRLKVGDTYRCILNDTEKYEVGSQRDWSVSEPFVGKIDEETAVFTALKTGKTYVNCGDVRIYYIEIEPKEKNWFAAKDYAAFTEGMHKNKLMCLHNPKKIKNIPSVKAQLVITDVPHVYNATIQLDKNDNCYRICFRMNNTVQNLQLIETGLQERMEQVKTNIPDIGFWIHKQGAGVEESIDYAAFVMIYKKQTVLFGIGHNWRQKGTAEEFLSNPAMFIHTFGSILEIDELPEILAIIEETPKPIPQEEPEAVTVNENQPDINEVEEFEETVEIDQEVAISSEDDADKEEQNDDWDSGITDDMLDDAFRNEEMQLEDYL